MNSLVAIETITENTDKQNETKLRGCFNNAIFKLKTDFTERVFAARLHENGVFGV